MENSSFESHDVFDSDADAYKSLDESRIRCISLISSVLPRVLALIVAEYAMRRYCIYRYYRFGVCSPGKHVFEIRKISTWTQERIDSLPIYRIVCDGDYGCRMNHSAPMPTSRGLVYDHCSYGRDGDDICKQFSMCEPCTIAHGILSFRDPCLLKLNLSHLINIREETNE